MTTQEIAGLVGGELIGDPNCQITGIASLSSAVSGQLAFCDAPDLAGTSASCVLAPQGASSDGFSGVLIRVPNPKLAFAMVSQHMDPGTTSFAGMHELRVGASSQVHTDKIGAFVSIGEACSIGGDVQIGDGARIGSNVSIGVGSVIHPNCVIYDNSEIGGNCVIHAGAVIGAPGFGYVRDEHGEYVQFPQIGRVVIGERVEIGANTCIDRGALGETRIGDGTKIDNLVQIAHNVIIGKRVVIASQTGISGSTVIEDDCVIGGQVGFGDHARVMSGAVIGSQAGILPGKIVRPGVWWGTPVQPLDEYKRQNAHIKSLGRVKEQLKRLEAQLRELSDD